jgi:ABC-type transport system substrate-binding protein
MGAPGEGPGRALRRPYLGRPYLGRRCFVALAVAASIAVTACTTSGPPPVVASQIAQTSAPAPTTNELTIGVDDLGAGFNPHTLADVGPVTFGVAQLVLPSAFRQDSDGALRPDSTLVESASVTAQQPFTVTYQLRREASWSDGAPIAAEDFAYLAGRMRAEPGVVSPAGYRLIRQVNSRAGGKQVDVVFDRPYPGWRTLFTSLLPSHLLKDAPGGWAQALETGIPVSGGPFAMRAVDTGRGLIVLERNDRYWAAPAVLDRLVLRQADPAGLVSALSTGGDQLAVFRADSIALALLRTRAPALAIRTLAEPVAAELLLRPAGTRLSDRRLRGAVAAALDLDDLVRLGSEGSGPGTALPARALTLLPSEPGYAPTVPAGLPPMRADQGEVAALLTAAGYRRAGTQWLRDGRPLRLVVAAPAERAAYVTLARRIAQELAAAGIDAELITPSGDDLFTSLTTPAPATVATSTAPDDTARPERAQVPSDMHAVDIAVVPRPVTGDAATDLVSWYGCAGTDEPAAPEAGLRSGMGAQPRVRPGAPTNPAGYCDRTLQASMDDLLTGASTIGETLAATEAALWRDLPAVPLFQHAVVLVTAPTLNTIRPGSLLTGPLADAPHWPRPTR